MKRSRLSTMGSAKKNKRMSRIEVLFSGWQVRHPNFMTPHVDLILTKGNRVVEMSSGTGFKDEPIFGVTEFEYLGGTKQFKNTGKGKMFMKKFLADAYADKIHKGKA